MSRKERLQKLRQRLSGKQQEVLKKRLQAKSKSATRADMIPAHGESGPVPLSFSQHRLWFLNQFEPNSPAYNEPEAVRLTGALSVELLKRTLTEMVRRHEMLRTEFVIVDGQPMQRVKSTVDWHLDVVDLSLMPHTEQEAQVAQLATEAARRPFDLSVETPWRTTLIQLSGQEHVFLLTMHHIVSDGWSMAVFVKELMALYTAFSAGMPSPLPELPIQYADFSVWQHQYLQGEKRQELLAYWQEALQNLPTLAMPTDHRRPIQQRFNGATQSFMLSQDLSVGLQELSQQEGVTLFMTLLAAFQILLNRYSGQEDIVVGSPIANRNRPELEGLIGFFVNTLVLRTDLSGQPTFRELLQRVRQVTLSAYAHQDLPFELIVEALQPGRDLSRNPLFQIMFVLQNLPSQTLTLSDLTLTPLSVEENTAKFDLSLWIEEKPEGLQGSIKYNTDLFLDSTIRRMVGHLQTLLTGIMANPDQAITDLPLLTKREKEQLLVEWNETQADYPPELGRIKEGACIHQLFEEQVECTPEAIAVVFETQQLTYQELNARANQLAHHLRKLGVGPDVLVGICVNRNLSMVVGLLAILKAGGAYVPLDPAYPKERIAFMLEDAKVSVLLTQEHLVPDLLKVDAAQKAKIVCLDTFAVAPLQEASRNLLNLSSPTNLAYVLYTSGSTGRPKGVAIEHHSPVALLDWAQEVFTPDELAGVLASTSICFDLSVFELFLPLSSGGTVILAENGLHLPNLPAKNQVTLINTVPSAMTQLVKMGGVPVSVQVVNLAGEPLKESLVEQIYRQETIQKVYNLYGPSEDTTYSTFTLVPKGEKVTIGRPIANTQAYILDKQLNLLPIGVPGELYLGGAGVARGYLNRPALTAERFIANPFGPKAHPGILYKTGDLVRYQPSSSGAGARNPSTGSGPCIEFLGRADYQVKIRGFRIELGEIETQLSQHEMIREVVVSVREEAQAKRLVAYIVAKEPIDNSTLRTYLGQTLPDYMIPSAFVQLETMPLTPNGKINRRALPAPEVKVDSTQHVLPRTPVETILASIWQEVLGLQEVGVTDNFFQVGGDSILSLQIVNRAKDAGIYLTPRELFKYQTIAELASVTKETQKLVPRHEGTHAEQGIVTGVLPLTPIQHWFLEQKWSEPHHFNQAVLLELSHEVNPVWLEEAVKALLTHHDALRLRFERQGDSWRQEISAPLAKVPFEVIELSAYSPEEQEAELTAKANQLQASLNLSQGPLLRVALFTQKAHYEGRGANRLLIVIHHLAVDGVSWRILLEDLQHAYLQLADGKAREAIPKGHAIQLPAKSTSFKKWAALLKEQGPSLVAEEREYWAQACAATTGSFGQSLGASLPVDYAPRWRGELGQNNYASTAQISTRLTKAQTEALLSEVPAVYQTQINDLLLTALLLAFHEWTQEPTLLLELEGHGREELFGTEANGVAGADAPDLSRTVGWFTTIFPVQLEMPLPKGHAVEGSLGEVIKSIKEQLRRIPNRGIGYGILRYLHPEGMRSGLQAAEVKAEVSFNYLGQFDQIATGPLVSALLTESSGLLYSPDGLRPHLLEIVSLVIEGELQVDWTYSRNYHRADTIQQLANRFIDALAALIAHCQEPEAGGYSPSDFPEAELDQDELDLLLGGLKM